MGVDERKIVIWCGAAPNQKALANKLASKYNVAGIVIDEHKKASSPKKIAEIVSVLIDKIRFSKIYGAWKWLMYNYASGYSDWPNVPMLRVESINNEQAAAFTREINPDLIIVSGTGLVKEPLLSIPASIGIINLHTGLSPFVKGGPNCTNWCIANNEWHLVGNTIMWLNAGIDSGNIITTETIDIRNAIDLKEAHRMVMEHAHDLYIRAVDYLFTSTGTFNSVPQQSVGKGKLYLTKMWTTEKRKSLLQNWKERGKIKLMPVVNTVPLPSKIHHV